MSLFFEILNITQTVQAATAGSVETVAAVVPTAWWVWVIALFVTTFLIGLFGVMAGIGGGVLFVPLVGSFFPFHIDFVRGAGLFIALGSSLAAAPHLLKVNLASLKLAMPAALMASAFSIVGAFVGLWLSSLNPAYIQGALGVLIMGIVVLLLNSKSAANPVVKPEQACMFGVCITGNYFEPSEQRNINWQVHRTKLGLLLFMVVGLLAGMFGLGAGFANVPVLNMVMGAPLKVAVATSGFALSITDTTAAWIYLNQGAVLPIMVVPSMAGIMLGARISSRLLPHVKPSLVRKMVIFVLFLAGLRSIMKAFGV